MAYKIGDEEKDFKFIGEYATIESVYSLYPRGGCTGMWFTHTGDGNKRYNWSEFYNQWIPEDFVFPDPQNPTPIVEYLKGANGKSAYELAVAAGYSGTLTEWLESLKGNATNGKSAYELAVAAGYSGTLEQWLESFVSPYSLAALFLSAKDDDTAEGKITFEKGLDVKDRISSDDFVEGALGHRTTKEGDAEFKSLKVREFIETPELRKNRISVNGNEFWFTDVCVVESIEQQLNPDHFIIRPRLLEGDLLSFHSSDILRGIFSYGDGFYTCVLQVVVVHEDLKSMEVVTLNGKQPRAAMVLARQTNAVDTDRQGSIYADGLNKYIRVINGYDPENPGELGNIANLKLQIGDLSGINHPAFGQLAGYGLFASNVYLLGTIMQRSWDDSQYMKPSFWRGAYNALTLYGPGETVSFVKPGYGESTWICKKPTQGNDPTNTEFWDPYVSGGATGEPGADGLNSITIALYQRSDVSPDYSKPSDSVIYTFSTDTLSDPLEVIGDWSRSRPSTNGKPLWVILATASSRTDTATISTMAWSAPSLDVQDGEDGKDGKSIEFIFKRANTIPDTPTSAQVDDYVPEGWTDDQLGTTSEFPFEWACKRTKSNGVWSEWQGPSPWNNYAPPGNDGISVVSVVPEFAVNSSETVAPTVFSTTRPSRSAGQFLWVRDKITFSNNSVSYTNAWVVTGDSGSNGMNTAPITLYKRSASSPSMPSGTFTYTFASGVLSSGNLNGWSQGWPADNGYPCWVIYSSALSINSTAAVDASTFTPAVRWVSSGSSTAPITLYQRSASSPSKPSTNLTYTFSTKSLSGDLGNWSMSPPSSNGQSLWAIMAIASSTTDTDVILPGEWVGPSEVAKDGAAGVDSRAVSIAAFRQIAQYNAQGGLSSPATIQITATAFNIPTVVTAYYEFLVEGESKQNTTSNTYVYTPKASYDDMPERIEVLVREGVNTGSWVASDQLTIAGVKEGSSAIVIDLSNQTHSVRVNAAGAADLSGSGIAIEVWEGTTKLTANENATPPAGTFKVSAVGTNVTPNASPSNSADNKTRIYGNISAMSQDAGYIIFTITVKSLAGNTSVFTRKQTFSKTKDGAAGVQGRDGITLRVTEWYPGFEYHNDEALTSGIRYIDVVVVSSGATQTRHRCKVTHTSAIGNKPTTTESAEWQTFNSMAPIYTSMLISPHAVLDFIQGQKILLRDSEGGVKGLVSAEGDGATGWVFMAGSDDPDIAPFKVNQEGKVFMDSLFLRTAKTGARIEIDSASSGIIMYDGDNIEKVTISPNPVPTKDEATMGTTVTIYSSPTPLSAGSASVSINYAETPISKTGWIEPAVTLTIAGAGTWTINTPAVSYSVSGGSSYGSYSIQVQVIKTGGSTYLVASKSGKGSASGTIAAGQLVGMTAGEYTLKVRLFMYEEYNTCSASASISSGAIFKATSILTRSEIGTDGFNFIKSPTDYVLNSNGTFVSRKGKMRLEASDTKVEARNLTTNKLVLAPLDADEIVPEANLRGVVRAGTVSSGGTVTNHYGGTFSCNYNSTTKEYTVNHNYGSTSYNIAATPMGTAQWVVSRIVSKAASNFVVQFALTSGTAAPTSFDFIMTSTR